MTTYNNFYEFETAKSDPDRETREQAVFWLSQVRSDKAVPLLEHTQESGELDEFGQGRLDATIAQCFAAHPERDVFRSFPGAGAAPVGVTG